MSWLALGHVPLPGGEYVNANSALFITDPGLSQVIYYQLTSERPQLWLAVEGPGEVWVRLGVPAIPDLSDFRPRLALVGPGLPMPQEGLPLAVPGSMGIELLTTDSGTARQVFHEHFTDTRSWIQGDWEIELRRKGTYYLVAYAPDGRYEKLWVAIGRREAFTWEEVLSLPQVMRDVRAFHEVKPGLAQWLRLAGQLTVLAAFLLVMGMLN
ncbi:MAG: hypothetical protein ACP5G2_08105 [Candidatus Bipolaricaulaceae bacterium]